MIIDTEKLFHLINSEIAACDRTLEHGMFPQIADDVREKRRDLRELKTNLIRMERYADKASSTTSGPTT